MTEKPKTYLQQLMESAETVIVKDQFGNDQVMVMVHKKHLDAAIRSDDNVLNGANWHLCPNCGGAFNSPRELCSEKCEKEYLAYLNNPDKFI